MTAQPAFELADLLRRHGEAYLKENAGHLGRFERRVVAALAACRTAALGGHVERCDDCGAARVAYNSCRNRHCPKCQAAARADWLAARQAELLPVPYFHVVFALPPPAATEIAFQNKTLVYALLMRVAAEALVTLSANPKHLGARIVLLAILHTWGQTLTHHPHVHCVVPGGGVALDGQSWVARKPGFVLPVRALSRLFRRLFLAGLEAAFQRGELRFFGELGPLAEPHAFAERVRSLRKGEWIAYAKPPFGGPSRVLAYLARYAHRAAIANSRPVAITNDEVAFSYKDYSRDGRGKIMRLGAHEFIRRFLLHALPDGFHRIRHYGFLAKGDRGQKLEHVPPSSPPNRLAIRSTPHNRQTLAINQLVGATAAPRASVQTAAAPCVASAASRRSDPTLFAATPYETGPEFRSRVPPTRPTSPSPDGDTSGCVLAPFRADLAIAETVSQSPPARRHIAAKPLVPRRRCRADAPPPPRPFQADPPSRVPIAANPAHGFVQSGSCQVRFLAHQSPRRAPHITLQIPTGSEL